MSMQWHPEKPPFEFSDLTIPHTHDAISVSQHLSNVFVDYARQSAHLPESKEEELAMLVYNYRAIFTARDIVMEPSYDGPDITCAPVSEVACSRCGLFWTLPLWDFTLSGRCLFWTLPSLESVGGIAYFCILPILGHCLFGQYSFRDGACLGRCGLGMSPVCGGHLFGTLPFSAITCSGHCVFRNLSVFETTQRLSFAAESTPPQ